MQYRNEIILFKTRSKFGKNLNLICKLIKKENI